jgi:hypothetical protein
MADAERLERRLDDAAEAVRQREIVARHYGELAKRATAEQAEVASLRRRLADEDKDVQRLEGLSLTRVLASMRGARHDDIARERAEADAVGLKLRAAEYRLTNVRRELDDLRARWDASADAPAALAAALDEKEAWLARSADQRAPRLLALAEERGRLSGELHELDEAISAANRARQALDLVADRLGSASSWSTYDAFGGGYLASAEKHDRLDEAARAAAAAELHLGVLRTELAELGTVQPVAEHVDVGTGTVFLDTLLDNFVTDWSVADRIDKAVHSVQANLALVTQLHTTLHTQAESTRSRLATLTTERHTLLTHP